MKGFLAGVVLSSVIFAMVLESKFINRDILLNDVIYLDGRFYKLCEVGKYIIYE